MQTISRRNFLASTGMALLIPAAVTSGGLPPGLSLSPGGLISGIPRKAGYWPFTVTVTDAAGRRAAAALSITVHRRSG